MLKINSIVIYNYLKRKNENKIYGNDKWAIFNTKCFIDE